jgi:alpha-galactosidase
MLLSPIMTNIITLTTPTLTRELRAEPGVGFYTHALIDHATGTDYMAAARTEGIRTPEFDLRIDGRRITSLSQEFADSQMMRVDDVDRRAIGQEMDAPLGVPTESSFAGTPFMASAAHKQIKFVIDDPAVRIQLHYELDPQYPILHKRMNVRNIGTQPITITHVCVEDLALRDGDTRDWQLYGHYGTQPRELLYTGRVDDPLVRLRNSKTGATILALNGAPGHSKRTESGAWFWDGQLRWMYDTDLFPFAWTLAPGETWHSDAMGLAFAQEDTERDARWLLPSWKVKTSSPSPFSRMEKGDQTSLPKPLSKLERGWGEVLDETHPSPPWQYNTWDPFGIGIDAATVRALIPIAARMGFDVFTIDDGWQARYGDNAVSEARFVGSAKHDEDTHAARTSPPSPLQHGERGESSASTQVGGVRFMSAPSALDAIRQQVEAAGMRLGLWASLAAVAPEIAAEHPEWMCRDAHGNPKTTMTAQGEQIVMCMASPFAESAAQRLIDLVERYNLAYLKLDLTTMFNAYGEPPGCHAAGHTHASHAESIPRIYAAIADVCRQIHHAHPDVLIDLTFELWGQKHSVDYALLRAADQSWMSNVGDNRDTSAGARQARLLLYQRALAMPADALLIGNVRIDTGDAREKLATTFGSAPLLLGDLRQLSEERIAQVAAHIAWYKALRRDVPLHEGFFVLGSATPDARAWDGFARLSRAGEGMIVLFRNECADTHAHIRLPMIGDATYRLTRLDARGATHEDMIVSAAQFRAGVDVAFGEEGVQVIGLRIS